MKSLKLAVFISIFFVSGIFNSQAEVRLPKIFSSNMVLQQGIKIPVWGWASPGEKVVVSLNNEKVRTRTGEDGKWHVDLPVHEYGGPFVMTVTGSNKIVFENVMIGEVWICSGQSNMEMTVANSNNSEEEINTANFPNIRLFKVPKRIAQFPEEDIEEGEWKICTPENISDFSAVGYFFGRDLNNELDVAIGLLQTAWGGTVAETWTSPETIKDDPDFKDLLIELQQLDLKKYMAEKTEKIKQILGGELPLEDNGIKDGVPVWSGFDVNDNDWKTIKTPMLWENQGYLDIDGIGWYRKEIFLKEEQTNSNLVLHLGKVDDSDITWVNGIEIGKTDGYNKDRVYSIDAKHIRPGKNMIVVRVNDTGGGGGIYGNPNDQFLTIGGEKIALSGDWKFKISKAVVSNSTIGPNSYPTLLNNAMINPLIPYGIKGAIWYQGESNADRAKQYQRVFPEMITDWRKHWGQGDFPFLFVSLANYMQPVEEPSESNWAELREAQTKTLSLPNTGMALAIDIGEADDIHPKNKQDVGKRLALNAFKVAYEKNIVFSGPMYRSFTVDGNKAIVSFDEIGSGLKIKDKYGYLKGFSVAGADKIFYWAKAEVLDGGKVVVYSEKVKNPVAVRYGWANNPDDLNLYNIEGLPTNPFRTDDWPGITK